jgi:hypothetical protein
MASMCILLCCVPSLDSDGDSSEEAAAHIVTDSFDYFLKQQVASSEECFNGTLLRKLQKA